MTKDEWYAQLFERLGYSKFRSCSCYRVVNAKGELAGAFAFGGSDAQAKLLEADGIEVINGKVDLEKYGL
jgi:alkylated DNA nucleotide flippase Atl1